MTRVFTPPSSAVPPSLSFPSYACQIAPGITEQRPQPGHQPVRTIDVTRSGFATSVAENWYDNLTVAGNTSLNPFFYGTYLAETKPGEPVTRNKKQAFQADAVGAMHQIVPEHFKTPHTFRVEWQVRPVFVQVSLLTHVSVVRVCLIALFHPSRQPGRGGRLDWFTKSHKRVDENGTVVHVEGDGKGKDWEHSLYIPDFALDSAMGSKIPEEPSYLIFNTAISSTWGFPYSLPDWCPKDCYDCNNPKCACSFQPGFCSMMKTGKVAFKIDSVRVYQSKDDDAHDGRPHTVGCDPVGFPTKEYIKGNEYMFMREPPFVFGDKHPLRKVKTGGGTCTNHDQCGGGGAENAEVGESGVLPGSDADNFLDLDGGNDIDTVGEQKRRLDVESSGSTTHLDKPPVSEEALENSEDSSEESSKSPSSKLKGQCVKSTPGLFGPPTATGKQCKCNKGYTGQYCLVVDKYDDAPGAYELKTVTTLFSNQARPYLTPLHVFILGTFIGGFLLALVLDSVKKSREKMNGGTGEGAL